MRCSSCEPLLDAYLEATLRPREARAVARAFARLPRLRGALDGTARRRRVADDGAPPHGLCGFHRGGRFCDAGDPRRECRDACRWHPRFFFI